jgi:signal transduction histidine kinase
VFEDRLNNALKWINETFPEVTYQIEQKYTRSLLSDLKHITSGIDSLVTTEINIHKKGISSIKNDLAGIAISLDHLKNELHSIFFLTEPDKVFNKVDFEIKKFEEVMEFAQKYVFQFEQNIRESELLRRINELTINVSNKVSSPQNLNTEDEYIGLLKKEVTMYRDISAVGLAAELTSHEFNALNKAISDNISVLNKSLEGTRSYNNLQKIQKAFTSLERLHHRMSPLYRQTRIRSKSIILYEFIFSTQEYFASDFERYEIKIHIDISKEFTIYEAEPILFTPIINLLSNAIYWLMDQKVREIHFYMSKDLNSLYIHDTGPGVNKNDQYRIFEPYFSRKQEGRGLGLFLSRDILESKGHQLELVSMGDDIKDFSGACFCITFNKKSLDGGQTNDKS